MHRTYDWEWHCFSDPMQMNEFSLHLISLSFNHRSSGKSKMMCTKQLIEEIYWMGCGMCAMIFIEISNGLNRQAGCTAHINYSPNKTCFHILFVICYLPICHPKLGSTEFIISTKMLFVCLILLLRILAEIQFYLGTLFPRNQNIYILTSNKLKSLLNDFKLNFLHSSAFDKRS